MKKTLRMLLFSFLMIALILTVMACSEKPNTPNHQTTPEETTPRETTPEVTTPDTPKEPLPVDTLNGMNATQLYEKFLDEYFSSVLFDMELNIKQTEGETVVFASSVAVKNNGVDVYYSLVIDGLMSGKPMEVWFVDGVVFINDYGKKTKAEGISIDTVIGEETLDKLWGSFMHTYDSPNEYTDALATAQLYCLNGVYYYTVTVPVSNMEYDSVTETVYFNENGKVVGVTDVADGYYMESIVHSYAKPIEILPPLDANEYVLEFTPVDSINGMNAAQLYEKFEAEYKSNGTYEIQYDWEQSPDSYYYSKNRKLKVNGNDFYYSYKGEYDDPVEAWVIGDVAYLKVRWWEIKCARDNIDDIFGDGFSASLQPTLINEAPAPFYTALENAQLYLKEDVYFCTVSYLATAESTRPTTYTVFFDEDGRVIKIVDDIKNPYLQIIINYKSPVEILPPEDALGFYELPDIPKTEEEIYRFYVDACANLKNSQFLKAHITMPGVDYIDYKRYRENKHIRISINSTSTEHWIFNQKGYTQIHWNKPTQTPIDDAFLAEFTAIEELLPLAPLKQEELKNFDCYYNIYLYQTVISFEQVDESGTLFKYECTISNDRDLVDIEITEVVDGKEVATYLFNLEIDPENKIDQPD